MAKWNQFSPEVGQERSTVRAYGVDQIQNRKPVADSYKAQALRELAMRLELEDKVRELERQNAELIDQLESRAA